MKKQKYGIAVLGMVALAALTAGVKHDTKRPLHQSGRPVSRLSDHPLLAANYGKLPLAFEASQGQSKQEVRFLAHGTSYALFLTGDSAVLLLHKSNANKSQRVKAKAEFQQSQFHSEMLKTPASRRSPAFNTRMSATDDGQQSEDTLLRMEMVNANPGARVSGERELAGKTNYFIGNDPKKWRINVPNYAEVKYEDVYPGMDLVYYGNQGRLEYDFVVQPGADAGLILIDVATESISSGDSASRATLHIADNGDLVIGTEGGEVILQKPIVYQPRESYELRTTNRQVIEAKYALVGTHEVSFQLGPYDHSKPLVIDPSLIYSTYFGGNDWDKANAIAIDSSGNAYIAGKTTSPNIPITKGAFQRLFGAKGVARSNAFVSVLNNTGTALIYSSYIGGNIADEAYAIALDASNNAYVTGWTASSNFPTTAGAFQTSSGGGNDAFVTKLNATGSALLYSTYLGGSSYDEGHGMAVDALGNAYVTGHTFSTNFPIVAGARQSALGGYDDAFVTKLNPTGSALLYSTYLGANGYDEANGIALDKSGNAYVTGFTNSFYFPTTKGALQTTRQGGFDVFVSKLNPAGSLVYSTFLGGGADDFGYGIAVDATGNAYVAGKTYSTNFPTTAGAFQTAMGGGPGGGLDDAFVAKLNPAGSALVYSTYIGGSGNDAASGVAVDASGNASITGDTLSTNFPTTPGAFQTTEGGFDDAFYTKLNPAGTALVYSTYLGGSNDEAGCGIVLDTAGNAYVAGWTTSSNFPITTGAFQTARPGIQNVFVVAMNTH
jgi:hypothetical protein